MAKYEVTTLSLKQAKCIIGGVAFSADVNVQKYHTKREPVNCGQGPIDYVYSLPECVIKLRSVKYHSLFPLKKRQSFTLDANDGKQHVVFPNCQLARLGQSEIEIHAYGGYDEFWHEEKIL